MGTTNVRSLLFDGEGRVLAQSFRELRIYSPRRGWAEEEPEEIYRATLQTMRDAVKGSGLPAGDVAAVGFSAQMHGVTMVDGDGKPLTRLLTWLDTRAAPQCEKLGQMMDAYELYRRTGCPPLFIYPLAKVLWMRENMPGPYARCRRVLSAKDYIVQRMLGEACVDHSVAAGSQMLNIHDLRWDGKILEAAGLDMDRLPSLRDGVEAVAELPRSVAGQTGLRAGTPVVLGASDGALSSVGLGSVGEGVAAVNLGSSGAIRVVSERPLIDRSREMRFFCYYVARGRWLPGGAVNNAGTVLRWFRDNFGQPEVKAAKRQGADPYEVITEEAASVPPGAGGVIMVPFLAGERFPVRDPEARGVVAGLTLAHGRAHVIRALMEGVVFTLRWIMEAMEEQGIAVDEVRVSGGGARSRVWRQILADVLGKTVVHTGVEEASALGAAMLAAISLGLYRDLGEASRGMIRVRELHEPRLENHRRYGEIFRKYKELYTVSRRLR